LALRRSTRSKCRAVGYCALVQLEGDPGALFTPAEQGLPASYLRDLASCFCRLGRIGS
jgi:hypothetical protein